MWEDWIAVGGSDGNPTHLGHKKLIEYLLNMGFYKVIWIPSGARPKDKPNSIAPQHKIAMTRLTFTQAWIKAQQTELVINFFDVYGENTPTIEWFRYYKKKYPDKNIIWYTGADSVSPQEKYGGKCFIEAKWDEWQLLMKKYPFLIIPRKGYTHPKELNLSANFHILDIDVPNIASSDIKKFVKNGKPFKHLVEDGVRKYINSNGLYL